MSEELSSAVRSALARVIDPELRRPITELGMVKNVTVEPEGGVHVEIYLTTSACPKKVEMRLSLLSKTSRTGESP